MDTQNELSETYSDLLVQPTFPDYTDSILNLSCSILRHYGITPNHETLPDADAILAKQFKHVVVILLDGLGMNILEKHLSRFDFLRRNLLKDYSSVFPPTTTASTTTFLSGLSPIEHGWLGWDVYFEQENKAVTCFTNNLQGTTQKAADYSIPYKYLPYENIIQKINEKGTAVANAVMPFPSYGSEGFPDLNDWVNEIKKSCKSEKRTFTYAYWENPDAAMHKDGSNADSVHEIIEDLNAKLLLLCDKLKDTVVFITADHGHLDITNETIVENYPDMAKMLEREVCIEPRAISFYVKPEYKTDFPKYFNERFSQDYILFTKEEVLKKHLFGYGEANKNLTGLGDFLAAAVSSRTLLWDKSKPRFRSHHAGLSKEEMRIPLIWHEYKPPKAPWIAFYTVIVLLILFVLMCLF
ncbi:MAG: alkaline phosphatase family protein [Treponema sp.]|nr:alkaline phosphatase family protein [Treponema sp.]